MNSPHTIIQQFVGQRLLVVGDLMLDEFIWGDVRRISPEAPVPVVEVKRETWQAGGAGNVVSNLLELGAEVLPIGLIGTDWAGARLRDRLAEAGADVTLLITDDTRRTTVKSRIVAQHHQMLRTDRESKAPLSEAVEEALIAAFTKALPTVDAVVVSDYHKGVLTPRVLQHILPAAAGKIVCLDPKNRDFSHYRPVTLVTPNQLEAERATGIEITDDASLLAAARRIRTMLDCPYVLITRGEQGMSLLSDERVVHIPTMAREVYDVTGAGDTVIATLTLALAAGANVTDAAIIANYAAGVVVGRVGTATVSREDLRQAMALEPVQIKAISHTATK